jgi:hypothetical protein
VWESKKQALLRYSALVVLIGSIFLLTSTGLYLQTRMDSGSDWYPYDFKYVEVDLNSTAPQVNVTIETVRLSISHFNVSSSNASILVIAPNNTILLNHTAVSGYWIQGVLSPDELPDSNTRDETYTVSLTWDGTNSTVIFEYEIYGLLFWDSVPYSVILPGFYETLVAGLSLLAISGILFMYSIWSADSSVTQGMRLSEYVVILVGFLLPTLLRLRFTEGSVAYGIFSSFWFYYLRLGPWVVSMVSAPTRFYPDTLALLGLPLNLILCAALWLFRHRIVRKSIAKLFVYLSFLPQILALLTNVYSLVVHVSPAIYYIPIPLLQIAALRWLTTWSPDKTGKTL